MPACLPAFATSTNSHGATAPIVVCLSHPQLLGFPVQLLGLLVMPYLGVRWFVDGQSAGKDIEDAAVRLWLGTQGAARVLTCTCACLCV